MDVRILGEFEVRRNGTVVDLGSPKARAVMAVLLISRGAVVTTDRLVDQIWGDDPPRTAAHSLQTYISGLRRALGEEGSCIETHAAGYRLVADPECVDAERFERLASDGGSQLLAGDIPGAVTALEAALQVWRGSPLPDFAYSDFAQGEIRRLEELRAAVADDLAEAYLESGRPQAALTLAGESVAAQPLDERSRAILMRSLAAAGRQAEALRVYSSYRRLVGEELGIEPSEDLRTLEERILRQDPEVFSVPESVRPAGNLPLETTSFVGRGRDVEQIGALLTRSRLVTLLGVGGVGKSRLALRVAHELSAGYRDGAWKIDFLGLADPDHVPETAAAIVAPDLGLERDVIESLADTLADRDALVVLDNCESVAGGVARLAESLLQKTPRIKLLATSREPLEVQGEVLWRIKPLDAPDPLAGSLSSEELMQYDSVQLFCERASAADPDFRLDEESASDMTRISRLLEGIPLAVELAAARVRHMTLGEIEQGLDDRFGLLVGGGRTAPRRHRALDATIEWSFDHLSPLQQEVFSRLGVFLLEFPPEAAELVCSGAGVEPSEVRDALEHLIDRSLVVREVRGGRTRCRLFDTVSDYLYDRTGSRGRLHEIAFFLKIAQSSDPALRGPEQQMWTTLLGGEPDAARRCLRHAANSFREDQGAYLAGVAAALTTRTGRVGYIGGINPEPGTQEDAEASGYPQVRTLMARFRSGFAAGVLDTEPAAEVEEVFLTDPIDLRIAFRSPALGREWATRLYAEGCDVICHAAGSSGERIFEAARRMTEDTDIYRWGIGVDIDEYLSHEKPLRPHVLASVVKQVPIGVYSALKDAVLADRSEEAPQFDLGNSGVRLATTGGALDRHAHALADVKHRILAGEVDTGWSPS